MHPDVYTNPFGIALHYAVVITRSVTFENGFPAYHWSALPTGRFSFPGHPGSERNSEISCI